MKILNLTEAADALVAGGVLALPTDTVYGLAAVAANPVAVELIFEAKRRPRDVALPIMVPSPSTIADLGVEWPEAAQALAATFWPGALTIVVPVAPAIAQRYGTTDAVGFRQPNRADLLKVLEKTGPLAVTSANLHGEPPCTTAMEVVAQFTGGVVSGVLDGGACEGVVSTVVRLGSSWEILRHGAIAEEQISQVLGPREMRAARRCN